MPFITGDSFSQGLERCRRANRSVRRWLGRRRIRARRFVAMRGRICSEARTKKVDGLVGDRFDRLTGCRDGRVAKLREENSVEAGDLHLARNVDPTVGEFSHDS